MTVQGVVSTLLGFFLLGGVEFHVMNVLGIAINAIGGTWYRSRLLSTTLDTAHTPH